MKCSLCSGKLYSLLSKFLSLKSWGYGFYPYHWCHSDLAEVIHIKLSNYFEPSLSLLWSTFFWGNIRNERKQLHCFCLLLIWTWGVPSNCSTSLVLPCPPLPVDHLPQEKAWCHKNGSCVLLGLGTGHNPYTQQLHRGWGEPCSLPKTAFCLFLSDQQSQHFRNAYVTVILVWSLKINPPTKVWHKLTVTGLCDKKH